MASRYDPQHFQAAFCLWYLKLDSKCQKDLFVYSPKHFEYRPDEEAKTINYVVRGVTEHLKYELGLPANEQWIVLKWIQTYLDWELFRDARQIASMAIGHEELHEMTKRAVQTRPTENLWKPRPMTIEGGIFLAGPSAPTPGPSPAGSDSLLPLSSRSATPPSATGTNNHGTGVATRDPRRQAAVTHQTQTVPDPSGADGLLQPQRAAPEWPILRAPILGQGTPLRPAAPLLGTASTTAPLPGTASTAAPLPGTASTAAPLPGTASTAAPLPGMARTAAPLLGAANAAAPLSGTVGDSAPLSEERAPMARSPLGATPPSEEGEPDQPSPEEFVEQRAAVEPAQPEDFWSTGDGASGPLPDEPEDPAPLQTGVVSSSSLSPPELHPVGPAPLAIPEDFEVSPIESPRKMDGASGASAEDSCSLVPARTGRPSVAEVLQQWVVRKQTVTTTVEREETVEQRLLGAEAEPMIISGGNTPVAPDDTELDLEEESERLMDETRL